MSPVLALWGHLNDPHIIFYRNNNVIPIKYNLKNPTEQTGLCLTQAWDCTPPLEMSKFNG